ncbi:MAG: hypothetical protein H6581_27655 [Bacteroidia bacterium]|nr:hypothetical protein [Bacteroidia bacterium]
MKLQKHLFFGLMLLQLAFWGCQGGSSGNNGGTDKDTTDTPTALENPVESRKPVPAFAKQEYPLPQEVNFYGKVQSTDYGGENFFLPSKFYPIGWSSDHKFAWVREPADEACGCYFFEIVIQDLGSNEILWQWKYNSDQGEEGGGNVGENLGAVWKNKYADFEKVLNEHQIRAGGDFSLMQGNQFDWEGKEYQWRLEMERKALENNYFNAITSATLWLEAKGQSAQKVWKYEGSEFFMNLDMEVAGTLLSPYEPLAAVVIAKTERGYEGPPHVKDFEIVGSIQRSAFSGQ